MLPLVFSDPADYDRIREGDRVTLEGIADIAPGIGIECRVHHADGTHETLSLGHSMSANHLRWFRAGSALNALRSAQ
jgi:aconitate hydratase